MIKARTAPLKQAKAPAAILAAPGDWPGPFSDDFLQPAQVVVAE